jgi:hypothetical protein
VTTVLLDEIIHTQYGWFSLEWGDEGFDGDDIFFAGQENGWVAAAVPEVLQVVLARSFGGSSVRIELGDEKPAPDLTWEDCVEVSITIPEDAEVTWLTFAGETGGSLEIPADSYRVRVSARDRDAAAAGDVVDHYLLQLWPAPAAPDAIIRVGSKEAAYWHKEWGGRR